MARKINIGDVSKESWACAKICQPSKISAQFLRNHQKVQKNNNSKLVGTWSK
uniref:Uncharacterized protein n=1 Tax=Arundo donax TaxID=35708 RepID=A0A0A9CEZ9_ARUDO